MVHLLCLLMEMHKGKGHGVLHVRSGLEVTQHSNAFRSVTGGTSGISTPISSNSKVVLSFLLTGSAELVMPATPNIVISQGFEIST